jgi:hypothetical protein
VWFVFESWVYLNSQGITSTILGKISQEIIFPFRVFLLIVIPIGIMGVFICDIVMVAREFKKSL